MTRSATRDRTVPVKPLHGPEPPGPPRGWILAVLTALAGLAGGYLLGASSTPTPLASDVPEVPPATLIDVPVEPVSTTVAVVPPDTPPPVVTAPPRPSAALADLVPDWRGTLWISGLTDDPEPQARVWTWPYLLSEPAPSPLDLGTDLARFDAGAAWIAVLNADANTGLPVLRAGDATELARVMDGVSGFAWHATRPGHLAWLTLRVGDRPPEVNTGTVEEGGVYFRPVVVLEDLPAGGPARRLVRYDDHGFVIEESSTDLASRLETSRVISLDPEGTQLGSVLGIYLGGGPSGTIAIAGYDRESGDVTSVRLLDRNLGEEGELPWSSASQVIWSPDGTKVATVVNNSGGPVLHIGLDPRLAVPLSSAWAQPLTWSPDGRFVILRGGDFPSRPVLIIADVERQAVSYLLAGIFVHQVVAQS